MTLRWQERLTSLWAPVSFLALALIPYLLLVELWRASAQWALPAMRYFGALMAAYFVGLLAVRLLWRRFAELRAARHEAREQLSELRTLLERARTLAPATRVKISEEGRA